MDAGRPSIVLATTNPGKIRELSRLLGGLSMEVKSLRDFPNIVDVEETGTTFRENAELKARSFAVQTGELSLADDSGLEIEALGNAPGVHSARFAGASTAYDVKIPTLLKMLDETGDVLRRARFVCVAALANSSGEIVYTGEGVCHGTIAQGPRGSGGFGYDPVFIPDGFDQTFGELTDDVKQKVSHRARATELVIRYLQDFIAV